jgi:hypothetical protein
MSRSSVLALAAQLMAEHGLTGWTVAIDQAKTRRGCCNYRSRRITVSAHLFTLGEDEVRSTLLHEIAHALVGPGHNHGPVWEHRARAIGAGGKRCGRAMDVAPTWAAQCAHCGTTIHRHRRPPRRSVWYCSCSRRLSPRLPLVWARA